MRWLLCLLVAGVMGAGAVALAQLNDPFDGEQKSLQGRTYTVYTPPIKKSKWPVVIMLHGGSGTGTRMRHLTFNGFEKLANQDGFMVVYPEGYGRSWNDGREDPHIKAQKKDVDDVAFLSALIDELVRNQGADPRRVYVGGISNGAAMSIRLACEISPKIAAIAPVANSMPQKISTGCKPSSPVSMILVHGTKDPLVPYSGGQITIGRQKRGEVIGVEKTARKWASLLGFPAKRQPTVLQMKDGNPDDGMSVVRKDYRAPKGDVAVYTIVNGGHTWPGGLQYALSYVVGDTIRDLDASSLIWEFFKAHPKQ